MAVYWIDMEKEEKKRDDDLRKLHEEGNCPCDVCQSAKRKSYEVPLRDELPSEHDAMLGDGLR